MKFIPQYIQDLILVEPMIFEDDRGYFYESFRRDLFGEVLGRELNFVQDNESMSKKGVLRGLHYQLPPFAQAKLVRVIKGKVLDVAVDIRKSSPTYGRSLTIELTSDNKKQLFIPKGFAHGFITLSDEAVLSYKVDNIYMPKFENTILWNDAQLEIDWQLKGKKPLISPKDKMGKILKNSPCFD